MLSRVMVTCLVYVQIKQTHIVGEGMFLQIWRVADTPKGDKFQYTHFAHNVNSFDSAPQRLLASDSRLRPDRQALEKGDLSRAGVEKSRYVSVSTLCLH